MNAIAMLRNAQEDFGRSPAIFVRDAVRGLLAVGHNSLAVLGMVVVALTVFSAGRSEWREQAEEVVLAWLQTATDDDLAAGDATEPEVEQAPALSRATAADPKDLTHQQAAVAKWISRRYRIAPEPVSALVREAWEIGQRAALDPTLILAVMGVESSFNPFAQSPVGAQGLMQVKTRLHDDKYLAYGGALAAFDPISNLRVGVQVLKESIARAGNLQEGLRHYVGTALGAGEGDGAYVSRVLAEQGYLRKVADGKGVPTNASNSPITRLSTAAPTPPPALATPAASSEQIALLHP
jgi:soluble lytic murein transglycosylase-like protein